MESSGAVAIFNRSVQKHGLRYIQYVGDGDTSSFKDVKDSKPYGNDVEIVKLECLGHVQKRMGTRLRDLRKTMKSVMLPGEKKPGVHGAGRLSDKNINLLQNYYGMAIRQNNDNIYQMKKAIGATLFHCSDIKDSVERHKFCPRKNDGCCQWQIDQITGQHQYKPNVNFTVPIKNLLWSSDPNKKTIFRDLSDDALLSRCLHNYTQNQNEALDGLIWKKCPKDIFIKRDTLEMGVCSAILSFNDGAQGLCNVTKNLGLKVGHFTVNAM